MVRVPFLREDVACLRVMLRVVMVTRLGELVVQARDSSREVVSDGQVLHDALKFADVWHVQDHNLQRVMENVTGNNPKDEIALTLTPAGVDFYRELLTGKFDDSIIVNQLLENLLEICRNTQGRVLEKLEDAIAQAELATVPVNVFRPTPGRQ